MNNVERAEEWNSKHPEGTVVFVRGKEGRAGRAVPANFGRVFIRVDGVIENLNEVSVAEVCPSDGAVPRISQPKG